MTKLQLIIELRKIFFTLEDVSEDREHRLCLGLKLAKEIADKVWQVKGKLER